MNGAAHRGNLHPDVNVYENSYASGYPGPASLANYDEQQASTLKTSFSLYLRSSEIFSVHYSESHYK